MGYRPPPTNIQLGWAEYHRLHGLEVTARGLKLGKMLDLADMYINSGLVDKEDDSELTAADVAAMKALFRLLVGNDDQHPVGHPDHEPGLITSWNRDGEDGKPLPVSMRGIRDLELWEFQGIMDGYLEAGGVKLDDPLPDASKNGKEETSALMELESISHAN